MRISDWSSDVCSSDFADIDPDDTLAADAGEALSGQHAQDAALRRNRHVGDLVEEQGAAVRLFEHTGPDEVTPLFDPEQFLLDAFGCHPRRADDDDRRARPRAPAVPEARRYLLADPGRAGAHHAAARRSEPLPCPPYRSHQTAAQRGGKEGVR